MRPGIRASAALLLVVSWCSAAATVGAQTPSTAERYAAREQATRAELHDLLERLEAQAGSSAHSGRARDEARRSAELVRRRLGQGDFQVGDRVVVVVEGRPEMSDTLVVRPGPMVEIPEIGRVPLEGVLRAELQETIETHLAAHLRNPVVRSEALIRLSIMGAVGRPGFYVVPAHMPITDVIMLAGGPGDRADLTDLRVERGSVRIWEGASMERAIVQGRTIDHLNIQAGDRIVVPVRDDRDGWQRARLYTTVIGGVVSLAYGVSRLF